jgi:hypothetical protein
MILLIDSIPASRARVTRVLRQITDQVIESTGIVSPAYGSCSGFPDKQPVSSDTYVACRQRLFMKTVTGKDFVLPTYWIDELGDLELFNHEEFQVDGVVFIDHRADMSCSFKGAYFTAAHNFHLWSERVPVISGMFDMQQSISDGEYFWLVHDVLQELFDKIDVSLARRLAQ